MSARTIMLPDGTIKWSTTATYEDTFWSKVRKSDGCWEWLAAKNGNGRGAVSFRGKMDLAYHVAWILTHGEIPDDLYVLHRCDNPGCVNPDHLFLGTQADNIADKVAKGRQARGADYSNARLTQAQAEEIRTRYQAGGISTYQLAREYGVSQQTTHRIVAGRSYTSRS